MSEPAAPAIQPVRNHLLIRLRPKARTGVIIMADSVTPEVPAYLTAEVIATGPGLKSPQTGLPTGCVCAAGDVAAMRPVAAIPVDGGKPLGKSRLDTVRYFLVEDDAVIGILDAATALSAAS